MTIAPPAFEDTQETEAPLSAPAFEDTSESTEPVSAPSFEETQDIPAETEAPISASDQYGDKSSRFLAGSAEGGLQAVAGAVRVGQTLNPKLASFFDSVATEMGGAPISEFLTELQGAGSRAKDEYGVDPKQDDQFLSTLATAAGNLVPTFASGPAAPVTNALMMGEQGLEEAQAAGGTDTQQATAFVGNAAVGVATEYLLGLPALLKSAQKAKIPEKTFKALVKSVTKQMGLSFAREGSQETLEQMAQDVIAGYIAAYDPQKKKIDQKTLLTTLATQGPFALPELALRQVSGDEGKLLKTFLVGGLVGGPLGAVVQLGENVSDPKEIAPKEEMQDLAGQVDQTLADLVASIPSESVPSITPVNAGQDTPSPVPTIPAEDIPNIPQGTPEDLKAAAKLTPFEPTVKGESVVSTAVKLPSGDILTGDDKYSAHPEIFTKDTQDTPIEDLFKGAGFIIQDKQGNQRYGDREESLPITLKSGQVTKEQSLGVTKLSSEMLRENQHNVQAQETKTPTPEVAAQAIEPYRDAAIAMAKRSGATDLNAEDIFQEVQADLSRKLAEGSIDQSKLGSLVSVAVRNKTRNVIEAEQAQKRGGGLVQSGDIPNEAGETPITQAETTRGPRAENVSTEDVKSIEEAISRLPESQSKVMRAMVENPGISDTELASLTGFTEPNVRQAKARARQALRDFIRSQGIGENLGPGASNIRELRNARYVAAADIYEGLKASKQLDRATWEKNMNRIYEDAFDAEELDNVWAVSQYVSERHKETGQPFSKIIDQISGGKAGEGVTSIKNAQADVERRSRGLPAAMQAARRSQPALWDEAIRNLEDHPQFQNELISRLQNDPRSTVNDLELTTLLHAKIEAENRYEEAIEGVNTASTENARLEALNRAREAEAKLLELYDLAKTVGSEQGRAFAARKMLVSRDFSVARLSAELMSEQQEDLSDKQRELVSQVSDNVQRLESEQEARLGELEQAQAEKQAQETIEELNKTVPLDPQVKSLVDRILSRLDQAADKARKRMLARLQYTSTGLDPTILYDLSVIGASKIAHGLRDFSRWSSSMLEEFGDGVKPYLKDAFKQADIRVEEVVEGTAPKNEKVKKAVRDLTSEELIDRTSSQIKTKVNDGAGLNDLRPEARKLALAFSRGGVNTVEAMTDAIHAVMSPHLPITKRQVMDLWSGYGDLKTLDMEEAKIRLRDLKGQAQNLAKIEDLEAGQEPLKTGIERRKPSFKERQLIQQVNAARLRTGIGTMAAYKARLQNQIADLEARIQKKNFAKKPRKQIDISKDAEMVRLIAEGERWKKKFADAKYEARKANETKLATAIRYGKEAANVPRAVKSSIDWSAVLRQGGFIVFGNPARAIRALGPMFKATFSQEAFDRQEAEIRNRPNSPYYKADKLYLASMDGDLTNREEAFRSEFSDKIPGIKASNRAFIAFLNRLRVDSYDALVGSFNAKTPEQRRALASFVNNATGRGDLGTHAAAAETLATAIWSPRLLASRIKLLTLEPLRRKDAKGVRLIIAKEYAKTLTGVGVVMALGALMGAEIEKDPRSSDFLKLKFGNTRIDPWMGLQQITVLGSRLATQETKTQGGQVMSLKKNDDKKRPPWAETSADVIARFLRTKLTPLLGTSIDVLSGENVVGEKVTPLSTAKDLFLPLSFGDIAKQMEEQGLAAGTAYTLLNIFGMSVQSYEDKKKH